VVKIAANQVPWDGVWWCRLRKSVAIEFVREWKGKSERASSYIHFDRSSPAGIVTSESSQKHVPRSRWQ